MARRLVPRKAADYDAQTDGRYDNAKPPDDYTINPSMPVNLVRPSFKDGPLVFRPTPCLDYADPTQFQPGRKAGEPGAYTHWIIRIQAASYIGIGKGSHYTFLLYHPRDQEGKNNNPYTRFYYACVDAHKSARFGNKQKWDSDWNRLMEGDAKGGAAIGKPKSLYFTTGPVYVNGKRNYLEKNPLPYGLNPRDKLTVVQLPPSAGKGLGDLVDLRKESFDGDEEVDFSVGFHWGDPVGTFDPETRTVSGGLFVTVFNPKLTTDIKESRKPPTPEGRLTRGCTWDGKTIDPIQGYEVAVQRLLKLNNVVYRPDLDAEQTARLLEQAQFWFDDKETGQQGLLNIAPMEQQALWVAKAYQSVPKLVLWAWSEHEEFLTDEVKGVLAARVTAVIPEGEEAAAGGIGDLGDSADGDDVPDDVPDDVAPAVPTRAGTRKDPTVRRPSVADEEPEDELPEDAEEPADEPEPEPEPEAVEDEQEPIDDADADAVEPEALEDEQEPLDDADVVAGDEPEAVEDEPEIVEDEPEPEPAPVRRVTKRPNDEEVDEFAKPAPKAVAKPAVKPAVKPAPAAAKPAAKRPVTPPEDDELPDDGLAIDDVPDDDEPVPVAKPAPKPAPKPAAAAAKPAAAAAKPAPRPAAAAAPKPKTQPTEDDYFEDATRQSLTAATAAKARSATREGAAAAKPAPKPAVAAAKPAVTTVTKPAAKPAPKPAAAAAKPAAKPAARK